MRYPESPISPEGWLRGIFESRAVMRGQVIRRARRDIERYVGMAAFLEEVERRGFRAVENGGQVVVFCNRAPIRLLH